MQPVGQLVGPRGKCYSSHDATGCLSGCITGCMPRVPVGLLELFLRPQEGCNSIAMSMSVCLSVPSHNSTRNPAKASGGQPYETGSRNMAATQKNQLFDPGFLFTPSDSFSIGRTVSPQYKTSQTDRRHILPKTRL